MKKTRMNTIGNLCIAISLSFFIYLFYPILAIYLFPAPAPSPSSKGIQLWIPKIHASGMVVPNVDPWKKTEYELALRHGIAAAKGFALPSESGPIYLFAHSSGLPWELTRYNTVFLRLGELEKNDEIILWRDGRKYDYRVIDKKEVSPTQIDEVTKVTGDILIIQTCTPIGTDWKRLLVYAVLTEN